MEWNGRNGNGIKLCHKLLNWTHILGCLQPDDIPFNYSNFNRSGIDKKLHTVSHFSYAPLIKCKITQKRNMIYLFWDYKRKAHLYLHYPLQFHCGQIRNEWEIGSWRALPSKHHFTLHYFEWNSVHIVLFSGSYCCYARDKSRFILINI